MKQAKNAVYALLWWQVGPHESLCGLIRCLPGCSEPPGGAELKQCATAFPRLGPSSILRRRVGALPPRAACGEQDPESRPTVSPALLAIAFHRSDPDLAANFGWKLVGLCVRTLWAPSPPLWTNKPKRQGRTSAPHGRQLTACSGPRESLWLCRAPGEIQKRNPCWRPEVPRSEGALS